MNVYSDFPAAMLVIREIERGNTETEACRIANLSVARFHAVCKASPDIVDLYDEAITRGHDAMADALLNPFNHPIYGYTDPKSAKVVSDNTKWFLGRKDPARFGERVQIDHTVKMDKEIVHAIEAARKRVTDMAVAAAITHQPSVPEYTEAVYEVVPAPDSEALALAELLGVPVDELPVT